jgi:hypothetical protein
MKVTEKQNFFYFFTILIEILLCGMFIAIFIYFGMISPSFHSFCSQLSPLGFLLFLLSILVSIGTIIFPLVGNNLDFFLKSRIFPPLNERRIIFILMTLGICLYCIPLFTTWSTGELHLGNVGGLLPIFDAGLYYSGAEHVLDLGNVSGWNEKRPITSIFLATRLLLTNFDFRSTLILQAILAGISAFIVALSVSRTFGKSSGFVMFAALFAFSAFYLSDNMSESPGFIFACLSFSLLWLGIFNRNRISFLFGVFFLTISFVTRPGPFLIFPAIIIFAGVFFNDKKRFSWRNSFLSTLVIGAGVFLSQCIIWLYGEEKGFMSGNFATILYGLAAGGKGWQQYMVDFPYQYAHYSENELYAFLYSKSFELISANPQQFLKTILGLYIILPMNFFNDLYDITLFSTFKVLSGFEYVIFSIAIILIIIGIFRFFLYSPLQPIKILFSLIFLTTFISMPFYFLDGTIRTLVILTPYFGLGAVIGMIGLRSRSDISKKTSGLNAPTSFTFTIPVIIGIIIIISLFLTPAIGPMIKHDLLNDNPENSQPVCTQNETFFLMRVDAGIPYLEIMNENSTSPPFAPLLNPNDRIINPLESFYLSHYYDLTDFIHGNDSPFLFWGYALNHHTGVFILSPKEIIGSRHRTIQFCGESINSTQPRGLWVYRLNQSSMK